MKTVSLELAQLLTTAGIEVPSESYWVYRGKDDENRDVWEQWTGKEVSEEGVDFPRHNAPNADELAEVIPNGVVQAGKYLHIYYLKDMYSTPQRTTWRAYLSPINELHHMRCFYQEADSFSDAMAKMLIYLKREGIK